MAAKKKSADTGTNATWSAQPASGDFSTAANWSPATVPTGTATFGVTNNAAVTFVGSQATVEQIEFAGGAPAYTLTFTDSDPNTPALTISGDGCSNAGTTMQQVVVAATALEFTEAQIKFTGTASAGGQNITYTCGPATPTSHGGGAIEFTGSSTGGQANFIISTGSGPRVKGEDSGLPGGEVGFTDTATAANATFTTWGTTGTDGDTFGNAVFHKQATAAQATFANMGGTVPGGDGGNSQFYDTATAAQAVFNNYGGTVAKANGGDVAFDGTSNAGTATFHNFAATAAGGYGGVVSFNNNGPKMPAGQGSTAANATIHNYGAKAAGQGGGGHASFSAVYGSGGAGKATIINHGSAVSGTGSLAGHTTFSIQTPQMDKYVSSAASATIFNMPGAVSGAPGGYTTFDNYGYKSEPVGPNGPTAGKATIFNIGATVSGASGGSTTFAHWSTAANAMLLAYGGQNGGSGGSILFTEAASGGSAAIGLTGNAVLDISGLSGAQLSILELAAYGGTVATKVGTSTICLVITSQLLLNGGALNFQFSGGGVVPGKAYTILTAPNLASVTPSQFTGNSVGGNAPQFTVSGNSVMVTFGASGGRAGKPSGKKPPAKKQAKKPAAKEPAKTPVKKRPPGAKSVKRKPATPKAVKRKKR